MLLYLPVSRGEKGGGRSNDPRCRLNARCNGEMFTTRLVTMVREDHGQRRRNKYRTNIDPAKHSMQFQVAAPQPARKLERPDKECRNATNRVLNDQEWDGLQICLLLCLAENRILAV